MSDRFPKSMLDSSFDEWIRMDGKLNVPTDPNNPWYCRARGAHEARRYSEIPRLRPPRR